MKNYYKEQIEENGDICPTCGESGFDINIRSCSECGYNVAHKTISLFKTFKKIVNIELTTCPDCGGKKGESSRVCRYCYDTYKTNGEFY